MNNDNKKSARILTRNLRLSMPPICACCAARSETYEIIKATYTTATLYRTITLTVPTCKNCLEHRAGYNSLDKWNALWTTIVFMGMPLIWALVFSVADLNTYYGTSYCLISEIIPYAISIVLYLRFFTPAKWKLPSLKDGCISQHGPVVIGWAENGQYFIWMANGKFAEIVGRLNQCYIEWQDLSLTGTESRHKDEKNMMLGMSWLFALIGYFLGIFCGIEISGWLYTHNFYKHT